MQGRPRHKAGLPRHETAQGHGTSGRRKLICMLAACPSMPPGLKPTLTGACARAATAALSRGNRPGRINSRRRDQRRRPQLTRHSSRTHTRDQYAHFKTRSAHSTSITHQHTHPPLQQHLPPPGSASQAALQAAHPARLMLQIRKWMTKSNIGPHNAPRATLHTASNTSSTPTAIIVQYYGG